LGTLVQGAWGLLLGRMTGRADVVFGTAVSGRYADVPGIESMVGMFVNTLPVRMRWRPGEPLTAALARLQDEQSALLDHQHLGLARIQRLAGAGELFDTLVVLENYPEERDLRDPSGTVEITGVDFTNVEQYPLALIVLPGRRLALRIDHDAAVLGAAAAERIAARLEAVLETLAADPERPVAALEPPSAAERAGAALAGAPVPPAAPTLHAMITARRARRSRARRGPGWGGLRRDARGAGWGGAGRPCLGLGGCSAAGTVDGDQHRGACMSAAAGLIYDREPIPSARAAA